MFGSVRTLVVAALFIAFSAGSAQASSHSEAPRGRGLGRTLAPVQVVRPIHSVRLPAGTPRPR